MGDGGDGGPGDGGGGPSDDSQFIDMVTAPVEDTYDPSKDPIVLASRASTMRILNELQRLRDRTTAEKTGIGSFNAEQALSAFQATFELSSGEEWAPTTAARKRSTLIAAAASAVGKAPGARSSAAVSSLAGPSAATTPSAVTSNPLPTFNETPRYGGGSRSSMLLNLE